MKQILRYLFAGLLMAFLVGPVAAQNQKVREMHKVKKKETIFGISRQYGLTIQELVDANPGMNSPGYELKKDDYIVIPYPKQVVMESAPVPEESTTSTQPALVAKRALAGERSIRIGVMLPLHDISSDGRRMVEYYRGVLMACDSLKKLGISVNVHAWNTPEDKEISSVLRDPNAKRCDFIIGPLYSKQMAQLSDFVSQHDIKLVIPFSINASELTTNRNIFQIYQSANLFNESVIDQFMRQFKGCHPVFIDCNDTTSTKGIFTFGLRRRLEMEGISYGLTNLKSSEGYFRRNFSASQPNIVILNTGRSAELNVAIAKLNGLMSTSPNLLISLFGYPEWLTYTKEHLDNFYMYDTYIPAAFHYMPLMSNTMRLQQKYRQNFRKEMVQTMPRLAITGFDHTMFFVKGFLKYGRDFTGAPGLSDYQPVQTPLKFERMGNGGLRNRSIVFMHYLPEHRMETIIF
jgi:hypothetical protein